MDDSPTDESEGQEVADLRPEIERWVTDHGDMVTVWRGAAPLAQPDQAPWHWHVQARNGEIVGQGEGHTRKEAAIAAAKRHHPYVLDADQMPENLQVEDGRFTRAEQIVQRVLRASDQPVERWQVEFVARALEMEARYGAS